MTSPPSPTKPRPPLQAADVQGLSRLVIDATVGIVDLVERVHHTITSGTGIVGQAPQGRTRGVTGLVYRAVRGGTRLTGRSLDLVLGGAAKLLPAEQGAASTPARDATLAALNGVWGDHLESSANPLAITASLRSAGQTLRLDRAALATRFPKASARLIVLAHGLCMNDRQWAREDGDRRHDHGQALAGHLDATALYLHYNSGRHVSSNGRAFAQLLEALLAAWPVPVSELILIGHSMGGLVARSAHHVAAQQGMAWPQVLRSQVFLGTPHHGAPLERGGQWVDRLLGVSPYGAPFARLGKTRSAGITDLRFGNLQDADWQSRDPSAQRGDDRAPTPLPVGVKTCLVAATTAKHPASLRSKVLGDGLVRLGSALGRHDKPALALAVPESQQFVVTGTDHWDLLESTEVYEQMRRWLQPAARS